MRARRLLCLDLDGTLVDSRDPFASCLRGALADVGLPDRRPEELHGYLGPPIEATAAELVGASGGRPDDPAVEELVAAYRTRYGREGIAATSAFPGVADAVGALAEAGWSPVVVTSKSRPFAVAVIEHVGLGGLLADVRGPEPVERDVAKATTLEGAMRDLAAPGATAVMVGDRFHDVDAALATGIPAIGVTWAGGREEELRDAGAEVVVDAPEDLPRAVARVTGAPGG